MFSNRINRANFGTIFVVAAFGMTFSTPSAAQDAVYQPVDPSFGGNPFNSAHLLAIANAQNDFKDPSSTANLSPADQFARQLQSRLLSALSTQIVTALFGANPQDSGTFVFGSQTVSFVRSTTDITLTITDNDTGEITTIVIPTFTPTPLTP
jgi:curli production assembly/transport component CsgF